VLAALEAERTAEARHHLDALRLHPNESAVKALREELEPAIERAERRATE
jgi:lysophospholipase L1-like esterase